MVPLDSVAQWLLHNLWSQKTESQTPHLHVVRSRGKALSFLLCKMEIITTVS